MHGYCLAQKFDKENFDKWSINLINFDEQHFDKLTVGLKEKD